MSWQLDTTRHVKIWFSDNLDQWTNQINQLRLVRHRARHPNHTIHLFGCKAILSPSAQIELYAFCLRHKIQYHDIEEVQPSDDTEKQLLEFAHKEIEYAITEKGGCLATASDIIRLFDYVLQFGIYSDLDFEIDFRKLPPKVEIDDFLIDMGDLASSEYRGTYYISNSFIAAPEKHEFIRQVKDIVLNNYTKTRYTFGVNNELLTRTSGDISFEERAKLQNQLRAAYYEGVWNKYRNIILNLAGPTCFEKVFYTYVCKKNNYANGSDLVPCLCEPFQYRRWFQKYCPGIISGYNSDMSWEPGNRRLAQMEEQMHKRVAILQRRWRRRRSASA